MNISKKLYLVFFMFLLMNHAANAFSRQQREGGQGNAEQRQGPQFTEAQRTCLEGILGKPGEGQRPTHEQMRAASEKCGIEAPPKRSRNRRNLEEDQSESQRRDFDEEDYS